jgi:two-component system, OmpR family, phosphate regulon sensor histidine kinase PhoR
MAIPPPLVRALLDAIAEPALLIEHERTLAANTAARQLLGTDVVGRDVRLAIRQPKALAAILRSSAAEIDVGGIGGVGRTWSMLVRPLDGGMLLVRLTDQSAVRAAEKMRVDFVANASHELRTPLATVIGYAETLAEEGDLAPDLRQRFGGSIHAEARRMLRIVGDLMSLSRIEAERFVEPSERVSLVEVTRIAAENGKPLADSRNCTIEVDVQDGPLEVAGDFAQLLQLTDNLLANAIRYGCSGAASEVLLSVQRSGRDGRLSVRDQGEGIAAVHIPRVTERFYRVDAARSRDSGGTGLGLAIVKHIVERHRGSLTIDSTPGKGTEVTVSLPLA